MSLFFTTSLTELTWLLQLFRITPRHGPRRQHRSFSYPYQLPQESVYRAVPYQRPSSLIINLLPSNGRCSVFCFAAVAWKRILFQSRSLATAVSLVLLPLL
jgi:hypothetical protein